jgi:hypothetical protein
MLLQVVLSVRLLADQSEVRSRGLDGVGFPGEPDRWDFDARFELAVRLPALESELLAGSSITTGSSVAIQRMVMSSDPGRPSASGAGQRGCSMTSTRVNRRDADRQSAETSSPRSGTSTTQYNPLCRIGG